jgi:hypothetical protein
MTELSMPAYCEFPGDNHSTDRILVFMGAESSVVLCGYHAERCLLEGFDCI